jgi:predicted nucleic acid-binding protein
LFDDKNPERKSLTEIFFKEITDFDVYVSDITVAEIDRTPDLELRSKMIESASKFSTLSMSDDVEWLAREYVRFGAVPRDYTEDAYHIAVAVWGGMDYLLSWNFKHIVRKRTRDIVRMVNTLNRLGQVEIMTPAELL